MARGPCGKNQGVCGSVGTTRKGDDGSQAGEGAGSGWVAVTCLLRGTAAPQFLPPVALLEAGPSVAQSSRFIREVRNLGCYGKSLRGDDKEEVFLSEDSDGKGWEVGKP